MKDAPIRVALSGDLDMTGAAHVKKAVEDAVAMTLTSPVVTLSNVIIVDLANLDFVDSAGLSAFLYGRKYAAANGCSLTLAAPNKRVMQVLTMVGIGNVIPIIDLRE